MFPTVSIAKGSTSPLTRLPPLSLTQLGHRTSLGQPTEDRRDPTNKLALRFNHVIFARTVHRARSTCAQSSVSASLHLSDFSTSFSHIQILQISFLTADHSPTLCSDIMSQLRKSTRKKRQTQLTFTSIPSSSPAASQYNEQVARRAASVRYGETPIKRRRLADVTPSKPSSSPAPSPSQSPFGRQKVHVVIHTPPKEASQLPTPMASSQVEEKGVCKQARCDRICMAIDRCPR